MAPDRPLDARQQGGRQLDARLRAARAHIDSADAELLLAHVLGQPRTWLYAHASDVVDDAQAARYDALVARRAQGEPVAYLTGRSGFWTFELAVTPDTLIPRPETELLVEQALARLPIHTLQRVADLGTGSGAIALALAHERPMAQVVATDASAPALDVARNNAKALGVGNVAFRAGDWCAPLDGEHYDLIVSNPPYIAAGDPHLARGDLRHEPPLALACGEDGLQAIRRIVACAPTHLVRGGWLLLEHGWEQGERVHALLRAAGFIEVATLKDMENRDRVTLGCKS